MKPLISVIVPVYNVDKYIEKCIQSLVLQTYVNLEIVVVDDGSVDRSGEICEIIARKDKRIKVIHKKNGGLVSARKAGLQVASGSYIGFVDGDDYVEHTLYERLFDDLYDSDADFVHMGYIVERVDGKQVIFDTQNEVISLSAQERLKILLSVIEENYHSCRLTPSIFSKLYKSDFIKKCYASVPEQLSYGEDLICLCKCIFEADIVKMCDYTLYHYVKREGSITMNRSVGTIVAYSGLYSFLCKLFEEYGVISELQISLDNFFKRNVRRILAQEGGSYGFEIPLYIYPHMEELADKRVVIYGAGRVGRDYYAQMCRYQYCDVVGWIDQKYAEYDFDYAKVLAPEEISEKAYDFVVIAVLSEEIAEEIKIRLLSIGIEESRIKWHKPRSF